MAKHDYFSPKAIGNRIKAKGLQKLRWYCQMCEKQCRDENGFKCHLDSETHQRQMTLFRENSGRYLEQNTKEFLSTFLKILSTRHGTKRILANAVYQDYIADRHHVHMNSTNFSSLAALAKYLGREKLCEVDETERGWYLKWIDNSPGAMEKRKAEERRERAELSAEQREKRLIAEQVRKAQAADVNAKDLEKEKMAKSVLVREDEDTPIKLNLSISKPSTPVVDTPRKTSSTGEQSIGIDASRTKVKPSKGLTLRKGNPLKGNAFKAKEKQEKRKRSQAEGKPGEEGIVLNRKISNMEALMREEEARKRRRAF